MSESKARHIILGASGFIGFPLALRLAKYGQHVIAIDRGIEPAAKLTSGVDWVQADIGDANALAALIEPGDIIYALTGGAIPDPGQEHPRDQLNKTLGVFLTLLEVCRERRAGRLLYPSSGGTVYGIQGLLPIDETHPTDPISAYGVQKLAAEKYLAVYRRLYGLDSIVMRIGNPYGPRQNPHRGQGLIATLTYRALSGEPIEIWGDGNNVRDYIYIDDLIGAIVGLGYYEGAGKIFNIGSGRGHSINEIVSTIREILGEDAVNILWRPSRVFDAPANILATGSIHGAIGWEARTTLIDGIRLQIEWMRTMVKSARSS